MPPNRPRSSRNSIEQEGRISLAIQAFKNKEISSIREVARRFNIPRSTLRDRLSGLTERRITRANSHKLTETEEETIQNWILSLDDRGAAPQPDTVRETANLLLEARGTTPVQTIGKNGFITL
jgi:transposase-like protein